MYNFVFWRNPGENVPWDATQITECYRCERCSNKMVKVNDGDGIVVQKKRKGPVRLYLTDPIKTVFTEVQIHRVKPDLIIDHAPPCPAWSDFIPNTNPPCRSDLTIFHHPARFFAFLRSSSHFASSRRTLLRGFTLRRTHHPPPSRSSQIETCFLTRV